MKKFLLLIFLVSAGLLIPFMVFDNASADDIIPLPLPSLIALPTLVPTSIPTSVPIALPSESPKPQASETPSPTPLPTIVSTATDKPSSNDKPNNEKKDESTPPAPESSSLSTPIATSSPTPRVVPATISNPPPVKVVQQTIDTVAKTLSDVINPPITVFRSLSGYMYQSHRLTKPALYSLLLVCAVTFVSGIMLLRPELRQLGTKFSKKDPYSSLQKHDLSKQLSSMEGNTK